MTLLYVKSIIIIYSTLIADNHETREHIPSMLCTHCIVAFEHDRVFAVTGTTFIEFEHAVESAHAWSR